uniref:Transmembrane protein n=1 Tax=Parastrongyloides trichosuri TaxID=131310 RepID=A0A0N4ZSU3_PARTI
MKYLIFVVFFGVLSVVLTLKCDSYYQYQVQGFQAQSLDNVITGCQSCGYLKSNITDTNYFSGFFAGCLSSTVVLAQKYDNTIFNLTLFNNICDTNSKENVPYCQEITTFNNSSQYVDSKICCCNTDLCTREYYQK